MERNTHDYIAHLTTATHCNTLQHTATHCNTLQHKHICECSIIHTEQVYQDEKRHRYVDTYESIPVLAVCLFRCLSLPPHLMFETAHMNLEISGYHVMIFENETFEMKNNLQKRPTKETCKRDIHKRPTKETYKIDLWGHISGYHAHDL